MCRLVIWDKDREPHKDALIESGRYQLGMVVDVLEDGQDPGSDIWKLGFWRVVDMPGVKKAEMEYLTSRMPPDTDSKKLPRKRWNALDLQSIPAQPDANTEKAVVEQAKVVLDYVQDDKQIGDDPRVIG